MNIKVVGKNIEITDAIREYIEKRFEKFEKFELDNTEITVSCGVEREEQIVEVQINNIRIEERNNDLYASIDKDIDILEGQIRKTKAKKEKMQRDSSLKQINISGDEEKTIENEVIKNAYYDVRPISVEDAKIKLSERTGSIFYTFINVDTGKVNVIFKLKDSKNFGLIEPAN